MKYSRNDEAISQIIGEIFLLAIAVIVVSVLFTQVLSIPGPQDSTEVTIIGKIDGGHPVFDLQRGEPLRDDSKLIINIANGWNYSEYFLNQSFFDQYINNQWWNIGEEIILPQRDIPTYLGPRVEGTIIDTKTNAIVFWGILLKGSAMPYKGGIWHFNESFWSGISKDVIDSSGNLNNGTATYNPQIINSTGQPLFTTIDNNCGYFNGTNYIEVETSWSLNMTNQISVEAWMKPESSAGVSSTSALQDAFGFSPYIIHVVDNIYAVVSEDQGKEGMLQTVDIASNGENATLVTYNGKVTFGNAKSQQLLRPMITLMKEKTINASAMVLIAYNNKTKDGLKIELRTYNISTNGSINYTGYDRVFLEVSPGTPNRPSLQKITDNICAIAYRTLDEGGKLKTLNISSNGRITPTNYIYNESTLFEPYLFHVHTNVYGLAYRGISDKGIIKTFNINNTTGNITYISSWTYSETAAFEPCVTHVSGNIFTVVYRNDSLEPEGFVLTLTILPNGSFEPMPEHDQQIFEEVSCFDPCIVYDADNSYSVVFAETNDGSNKNGNPMYIAFDIENETGLITINNSARKILLDVPEPRCFVPIIIPINEHIFAITFTGPVIPTHTGHPGWLLTVCYPNYKGIFKGDSYMICANTNQVEGRINTEKIYYNYTKPSLDWRHIALTYDGINIRLYVHDINGELVGYNSMYYPNHYISLTIEDLYLGRNYRGYIDEIAIYEKALSDCQINYISQHLHEQRMLEYYLLGKNCWPLW